MEAEDQRKKTFEQNNMGEDYERSKGLDTCEVLVHSVLVFVMDHINNRKAKEIRLMLRYHFR